ncbi:MAG TPA: alpha/beta fold hydrolase [Candidatus Dormibacteraeota bacterium]|nr:alpha/beta fold hydrolase [Candidatus Dormibacteraeota bacterium]
MTISDDFSAVQDQFWQHYNSGRPSEALAVAERAWDSFPERRGYTCMLLAVAQCGLGRADAALEVLEGAESENHLWRLQLLRMPELESLRADPRFDALTRRAQARVAARNFQPRLLLAEPEPAVTNPTLLLGLHGASSTADEYHRHWLPATRLGCMVASPQSTQPATESTFCWDDRRQVRRDLESWIDKLPEHAETVLTGFSQGALVALELALTGDPAPAIGVIAVAPSFPPPERLPDSTVTLNVEIVYNAGDLWGRRVPVTAEALRSRGHRVTVEELPGLGHDFPHDFAERLPVLLRRAREGIRAP